MGKVIAYIKLMRPANILTAIADIMLGFSASGMAIEFMYERERWFIIENIDALYWLTASTIGLYAGGVVFNDFFDADLDKIERPERPIPSGKASKIGAAILGSVLFVAGIVAAYQVSWISALIATTIALLALLYDSYTKHHPVMGPINMGACRSGNLLLGVSVVPIALYELWFIALIPITYIGAITLISRGEVNGINKKSIESALLLYVLMLVGIINLGLLNKFRLIFALPLLILFLIVTLPSWLKALKYDGPVYIRKAVKTGVLSLIILDASLAAGFAGLEYGLLILLLLPVSFLIARFFAVT